MNKFAEALVAIASSEEVSWNNIAAEQAGRKRLEDQRVKAKRQAEFRHDQDIMEKVHREIQIEGQQKLAQAKVSSDYQTGLMHMLIGRNNLEKAINGLRQILWDLNHCGLRSDLVDRLSFLTNLVGGNVK